MLNAAGVLAVIGVVSVLLVFVVLVVLVSRAVHFWSLHRSFDRQKEGCSWER